jgi:hypothetical protein
MNSSVLGIIKNKIKYMKKIGILIMMLVLITITSCKKYLDIKPQFVVGDNLVVTSLQGLEGVLIGAFSQIQSGNVYGGGIIANSELLGDYILPQGNGVQTDFSLGQLYLHQMNGYNSAAGGMWNDAYAAIQTANTALVYLPKFKSQDSMTCNVLAGEALFIRAAMHYELVRMFAQPSGYTADDSHLGIPIRLLPGTVYTYQSTPRSSVAKVYAQVIADLKSADSLLALSKVLDRAATGPYYISKFTVEAYLAKVYFSQNNGQAMSNYQAAADYATKVISAGYSLNDSLAPTAISSIYHQSGPQTTNETVFQIINTSKNDPGDGTLHGRFNLAPTGLLVPEYSMNTNFVNILTSASHVGDKRFASLYRIFFGVYLCKKYDHQFSNVPVVRLAEMYLTRAECENQLGDDAGARNDYNRTLIRAGLPPDNSSVGQGLLNGIRGERDFELAMEGDHFFEVKRRKGSFDTPGAGVLAWNAPTMVYPIPQQEVNQNKSMVQNPGY